MKKIFSLFIIAAVVLSLSLTCFATEAELPEEHVTTAPIEEITTVPEAEDELPALTTPTEEDVEQGVTDAIDQIDKSLAGMELWETAKAWLLDNLSTVVGVIMAIATTIVGLATKFSFVPKIVNYVKTLATAIGDWYDKNTKQVRELVESFAALKISLQDYLQNEVRPLVEQVEQQSRENEALLAERNQLYREYIEARARTLEVEQALLDYTRLAAEEFEDLIQTSDLTKADLDRHYDNYKSKVALIEAVITPAATEGGDVA